MKKTSTYVPAPIDTAHTELTPAILELIEKLAANSHDVWAAQRIAQGWSYGPQRDDVRKETPCLVPYDELPESEKEYDRQMATETLKVVLTLGFEITPKP